MTPKQAQLIDYIIDHGQIAQASDDPQHLIVTSQDQYARPYTECIPALWFTVREWLGY